MKHLHVLRVMLRHEVRRLLYDPFLGSGWTIIHTRDTQESHRRQIDVSGLSMLAAFARSASSAMGHTPSWVIKAELQAPKPSFSPPAPSELPPLPSMNPFTPARSYPPSPSIEALEEVEYK